MIAPPRSRWRSAVPEAIPTRLTGTGPGSEWEAGVDGRIAEHVLQELLPDEHGSHQRAEDDDPRAGRHPEGRASRRAQVVERVPRPALPDEERDQARGGHGEKSHDERRLVRH